MSLAGKGMAMIRQGTGLLCAVLGLALLPEPASAQAPVSTYSRHDYQKCPRAKPDEDGVSIHRCKGQSGIVVTWTAGDDSSSVSFGARPADEPIVEAPFFEAGTTIEWRGPKGGKPQAAILRYKTGQRIGKLDGSRLVVHRLGPDGSSCVIGSLGGREANANAAARQLANEKAAGFRCGQDKPVAR